MRLVFLVLCVVCLIAPSTRAQHCGFDFSSIIIIHLEPSGLTQVQKIEAVLPDKKVYRFWKNELPKDGRLPKIIHTPSVLDSHSYWFADTNYVIAGPLGHKQYIPIILTYTTERAPDTLHIAPEYIHSLCSNHGNWAYFKSEETRARFKPIELNIYRARMADTIGTLDYAVVTDRKQYRYDDTVIFKPRPALYFASDELKTDGGCHAKVVYGAKQKIGDTWKELWPVQQIQDACGPGYTFGFSEMRFRTRPDLKPGIYRLFFENKKGENLETWDFEIIDTLLPHPSATHPQILTDKSRYKRGEPVTVILSEKLYSLGEQVKTDGACGPEVVYGVWQWFVEGWKQLWSVKDHIQMDCGPSYVGFGKQRQVDLDRPYQPKLPAGVYKLEFQMRNGEIFETNEFELAN